MKGKKLVDFEATIRGQRISFSNIIYGKICNKKLGDFVGKKVKVIIEEL